MGKFRAADAHVLGIYSMAPAQYEIKEQGCYFIVYDIRDGGRKWLGSFRMFIDAKHYAEKLVRANAPFDRGSK